MNSSINVNRLPIPKVLGDIARTYNINFVNYSQYSENTITVYRSGDPDSYQQFLKDEECHLPLKLSQKSQVIPWEDYCSDRFLEYCLKTYKQYPNGACIILKHTEFAEHISIGTANPKINLYQLLTADINLKRNIVMRIRNSINFNLDDFSPSTHHDNAINSSLTNSQEEADQHAPTELMVIGLLGPTQLSSLEKICFLGLLELKTNNMLAAENKVSVKSIERRVAKLKSILGVKTRNDFFIIAKKTSCYEHLFFSGIKNCIYATLNLAFFLQGFRRYDIRSTTFSPKQELHYWQ